jgi:hypothetical protein
MHGQQNIKNDEYLFYALSFDVLASYTGLVWRQNFQVLQPYKVK